MTLTELQEKLTKLRKGLKLFDLMLRHEEDDDDVGSEEGEENKELRYYLTPKQVKVVRTLFKIFRALDFKVAFANHRELVIEPHDPIDQRKCGIPVKVRSCLAEHGTDTHFGILLGEVPLHMGHSVSDNGVVTASMSHHNPAIYVPALKAVVYGCQSWWGEIDSQEELQEVITNDTINDIWYVQMLTNGKPLHTPDKPSEPEQTNL